MHHSELMPRAFCLDLNAHVMPAVDLMVSYRRVLFFFFCCFCFFKTHVTPAIDLMVSYRCVLFFFPPPFFFQRACDAGHWLMVSYKCVFFDMMMRHVCFFFCLKRFCSFVYLIGRRWKHKGQRSSSVSWLNHYTKLNHYTQLNHCNKRRWKHKGQRSSSVSWFFSDFFFLLFEIV
jgi:hypothetical protein